MPKDILLQIIVIVSGQAVPVEVNPNEPALNIVREALRKSGNVSQGVEGWELRDAGGVPLDVSGKVSSLGLVDGAQLALQPRAAAGG